MKFLHSPYHVQKFVSFVYVLACFCLDPDAKDTAKSLGELGVAILAQGFWAQAPQSYARAFRTSQWLSWTRTSMHCWKIA
eukprot:3836306-Amphidinium_carterae.1